MTLNQDENLNEIISLAEASKLTGYHPDYLGYLCRQGKLRGFKIGRNWSTTKQSLDEFISTYKNGINEVVDERGQKIQVHVEKQLETAVEVGAGFSRPQPDVGRASPAPTDNSSHILELDNLKKEVIEDLDSRVGKLSQAVTKAEEKIKQVEADKQEPVKDSTVPIVALLPEPRQGLMDKFSSNFELATSPEIPSDASARHGVPLLAKQKIDQLYNSFTTPAAWPKYFYSAVATIGLAVIALVGFALWSDFNSANLVARAPGEIKVVYQNNNRAGATSTQPTGQIGLIGQMGPIGGPVTINKTVNQLLGFSKADIYSLVDERLNQYLAQGKFVGPPGPAGAQGPQGRQGLQGSSGGGSYAPITYIQPLPSGGSTPGSIGAVTYFSAESLTANEAKITNLTVTGSSNFANPATFNGVTYNFPGSGGTIGQSLITDGAGNLSWTTITGGSGGSGNVATGTPGAFAYYPSAAASVSPQSLLFLNGNNIGIGTSTGGSTLTVVGTSSNNTILTVASSSGASLLTLLGNGNLTVSGQSTFATTTVSALTVTGATTLNGLTYNWPSSQSAGTFLKTDGSGNLTWSATSGGGAASSTGAPGNVQLAGPGGNLNADALFTYDTPTHRLSIGTTSSSSTVTLQGQPGGLPLITIASSSGTSLFQISANGSTTIASLGTGIVRSSSGSLFNGLVGNGDLVNSSITISTSTGITGGGVVALGGSVNIGLASTGTPGTYGSASQVPVLTTNQFGQITSVSNTNIALATSSVSGVFGYSNGGTGQTAYTTNGVIYAGASALQSTAAGTVFQLLTSNGSGSAPTYRDISSLITPGSNLATSGTSTIAVVASPTFTNLNLTGTLSVTGSTTLTVLNATGTSTLATTSITSLTVNGNSISGSNTGDVTLAGQNYLTISGQQITANPINLSGGNITNVLNVSNGGTGANNLTANDVLFGNGTNAVATSSGFTFSGAAGLTVNATSTLATTTITNLTLSQPLGLTSGGLGLNAGGIAKGGLFSGTGSGVVGIQTVGSDGLCLVASSTAVSGLAWTNCATASGAITSLNGQTNATQTFATGTDANITLAITSAGGIHTFTPGFTGQLSVPRGGTGQGALTSNALLLGNGSSPISTTTVGINGQLLVGVTASAPTFVTMSGDASINNSGALTLGTVNSNIGTFGAANQTLTATVNGKGLVTAISTSTIAIDVSQITSGALGYNRGGTGSTSYTTNGVVYAGAAGLQSTATGTTFQILTANGNNPPTYRDISSLITPGSNIATSGTSTIAVIASPTFTNLNLTGTLSVTGSTTLTVLNATGTSTLATTSITSLSVNGNSISGSNTGDVTLAGQNYLSISGQQITANPINLSGGNITSVLNVANGGTGTSTAPTVQGQILADDGTHKYGPANLLAGTNITITTTTPGQITIAAAGSTPCAATGYSLQYDNNGSFGCVSKLITDGNLVGYNATSSTVGFNIQGTAGTNDIFNVASSSGNNILKVLAGNAIQLPMDASSTVSATTVGTAPVLLLGSTALSAPSSSGTYIGINAPNSFQGNLLDIQRNNVSRLKLDQAGNLTVEANITMTTNNVIQSTGGNGTNSFTAYDGNSNINATFGNSGQAFDAKQGANTVLHITNTGGSYQHPTADATNAFQFQTSGGANILDIDSSNKRVGIGTGTPLGLLSLANSVAIASGSSPTILNLQPYTTGTLATGNVQTALYGVYNVPQITLGNSTSTISSLYSNYIGLSNATGTVTNYYGDYIAAPTGAGTISNKYALVTETNAGNVGIGTASPAQLLTVGNNNQFTVSAAGNATATSLALTGLLGQNCLGTSAGGLLQAGSCGSGSSVGWASTTNAIYNNFGYMVGINSSTPIANLSVVGSSTAPTIPILTLASSSGAQYLTVTAGGDFGFNTTTPAADFAIVGHAGETNPILQVATSSNAALLTVTSGGNIGFNIASPLANVHVAYDATAAASTTPVFQLGATALGAAAISANGTYLGLNAPSSFTGDFIQMESNGTQKFKVNNSGFATFAGGLTVNPGNNIALNISQTVSNVPGIQDVVTFNGSAVNTVGEILKATVTDNTTLSGGWKGIDINTGALSSATGTKQLLSLQTNSNPVLIVNASTTTGSVGIGTSTPQTSLSVVSLASTIDPFDVATATSISLFHINQAGAVSFNNQYGAAGSVLQTNGNGSPPAWVATTTLGFQPAGTYVTSVTATGPVTSSGGTMPNIAVNTGDLNLSSSNLSFTVGDGKKILLGTSTTITLSSTPAFTTVNGISLSGSGSLVLGANTLAVTGNATTSGANTGDVTLAGQNYLSLSGQQITANPINLSGGNITSVLNPANGGTGTSTAPSQQGQILIADSTGGKYAPGTLVNSATLSFSTSTAGQLSANVLQVPNSITFNNGGAGASSGQAYNGSAAATISYNTIGAQAAGTYVTSVSGSGSILSSGGTTPTIQLQNLTANDILFGQGNNTFATSTNFTFSATTGLTVNATSTLATTSVTSLSVNGNSISGSNSGDVTIGSPANGLSLSNQILSIALSGTAATGSLSSTDWNTFNNKVSTTRAINTAYPLQGGGNLSADRTLTVATGDLTLGSNLSFTGGDGKQILLGTSTQISISATPSFTSLSLTNALTPANGGTGTSTAPTVQGQILADDGTHKYGPTNLIAGSNVTITTTTPGQITIALGGSSVSGSGTLGQAAYFNGTNSLTSSSALLNNGTVVGVNATSSSISLNVQGSGTLDPFNVASSSGTSYLRVAQAGNVGIGTTSPLAKLDVWGNFNVATGSVPAFYVNTATGNVGIGTTTPGNALTVIGSISSSALTSGNCVQAGAGGVLQSASGACGSGTGSSAFTIGNGLIYNSTSTDLVGIGTITPTTTLFVQGKGGTNPFAIASSTGTQMLVVTQGGDFGFNTTTPAADFAIVGHSGETNPIFTVASSSNAQLLTVASGGNVGVGTTTPGNALTVVGSISSSALTSGNCVQAGAGGVLQSAAGACGSGTGSSAFTIGNGLIYNSTSTDLVGIGTITPTTTLFVQGKGGTNPFAIASSTGTQMLVVTQAGNIGVGTTTTSGLMTLQGGTTNQNLFNITSSTGVSMLAASWYGGLVQNISSTTAVNIQDGSSNSVFAIDTTQSSSNAGLDITAGGAQTGNLLNIYSSGSTLLLDVSANGQLQQNIQSTTALQIQNGSGVNIFKVDTLNGVLNIATTSSTTINSILTSDGNFTIGDDGLTGNTDGRIWLKSRGTLFRFKSTDNTADYSEYFYQLATTTQEVGTVMTVDTSTTTPIANAGLAKQASSSYDSNILGVVTNTGTDYNNPDDNRQFDSHFVDVGLLGHIKVKVTDENGPIAPGDYLTSSAKFPGYAMKATRSGRVIGTSLVTFPEAADIAAFTASSTIASTSSPDSTVDGVATSSVPSLPLAPAAPVIHLGHALTLVNPSFEIINNTFVLGANDGQLSGLVGGGVSSTADGTASSSNLSFLIDQQGSGNILQLQNNEQNRFLVASSGSVSILAAAASSTANILTVSNGSSTLFTISSVGDVTTVGHLTVGKDTAGTATIKKGDNQVAVTFAAPYASVPKIAVTAQGVPNFYYGVIEKTATGFTIQTSQPMAADMSFDWVALAQPQDTPSVSSLTVAPPPSSTIIITPPSGGGSSSSSTPDSSSSTPPSNSGQVAGTSTLPSTNGDNGGNGATSTPPADSTPPPASSAPVSSTTSTGSGTTSGSGPSADSGTTSTP